MLAYIPTAKIVYKVMLYLASSLRGYYPLTHTFQIFPNILIPISDWPFVAQFLLLYFLPHSIPINRFRRTVPGQCIRPCDSRRVRPLCATGDPSNDDYTYLNRCYFEVRIKGFGLSVCKCSGMSLADKLSGMSLADKCSDMPLADKLSGMSLAEIKIRSYKLDFTNIQTTT